MNKSSEQKDLISNNYISRKATNFLKGIALIMMFIHHFFTFPHWIIGEVSYGPKIHLFAEYFNEPLKLCVSIFAFLTGYFYFYHKRKDLKYSLKKASDVWVSFAIVFLIFFAFSAIAGANDYSTPKKFILELFGLESITMVFCWYVLFYIVSMFILPYFAKLAKKSTFIAFSAAIFIPPFLGFIISRFVPTTHWIANVFTYFNWFKCIAAGYLFAQLDLFNILKRELSSHKKWLNVLIAIILILASFFFRFLSISYDFICAPLFIFGILELFYMIKNTKIFTIINIIGKYSLPMWFAHCIFFNQCKEFTQPILYAPHNPILVLIWGTIICLSFAYLVQYPTSLIIKLKDKLLRLK